MITGERVSSPEGGFNPTFQRHVAAYRLIAPLLSHGRVLDLGCGVGHSYRELAPRVTVGVDREPSVLAGQDRETHAAVARDVHQHDDERGESPRREQREDQPRSQIATRSSASSTSSSARRKSSGPISAAPGRACRRSRRRRQS